MSDSFIYHMQYKASLGFVKVLVTSLHPEKLLSLQADIMTGILPWSSFTKHHFKGKVSHCNCSMV
jgi:ribosomal RNA-processing protein 12